MKEKTVEISTPPKNETCLLTLKIEASKKMYTPLANNSKRVMRFQNITIGDVDRIHVNQEGILI